MVNVVGLHFVHSYIGASHFYSFAFAFSRYMAFVKYTEIRSV